MLNKETINEDNNETIPNIEERNINFNTSNENGRRENIGELKEQNEYNTWRRKIILLEDKKEQRAIRVVWIMHHME